ncbi:MULTISPECIES: helix-turn-helix domain-containing protein [Chryseobacterium]|uniref:AraC family transcriptional regulator of adaptative response / methylphosphotriester-DNA alkyltransferase methyltransferase n=1 Tax=Chryseobacterium camelliae TaxID=1265445 RepID=A0ABU0TFP3_9FLAO|nr:MULTISPECIES: AraC family transcriptional regulator [Chryseobacterium]MDT3406327.1 AraC family transcriptional regulator of adaptative response / methylphosphotriester-DNA alkyltransferase methyltransferase [Pseudacidovorax intermedius]MDQ1095874.1 AraC family transcriptional regulator of adaptative response / methylphosphotriester-DNA alkyltransferase methyltransferase [Chryseobacterium camelliae]MDQ1099811.1 AraC family transcriptional regulator of adaptative response / methylphosphotrieste
MTRPSDITESFVILIEKHLDDLTNSKEETMFEIEKFAELLCIHPTHLSNTIKQVTGETPCGIYQMKILETAKKLLSDENLAIKEIAYILSYDPSQFTKWFKRFTGETPKSYRRSIAEKI